MPSALQPQLRSAARTLAQQPSKVIQRPSQREFHQSLFYRASEPSRNSKEEKQQPTTSPIANGLPEIEELPKDLQKNSKLKELYTDLTRKRADIQELLKGQGVITPDDKSAKSHSIPEGNESTPGLQEAKFPFHGSALRRRLRATAGRGAQKPVQRLAPEWFIDWNIRLAEERNFVDDSGGSTIPTWRSGSSPDKEPSPDSTERVTEAIHEQTQCEQSDSVPSAKDKDNAFEIQLQELETIARGLLRLSKGGNSFQPNAKPDGPHLMLGHYHHRSKMPGSVWRGLVEDLAKRLNSDLIVLNAQDIGELISSAGFGVEITSEALSLNYDIWEKTNAQEFFHGDAIRPQFERVASKRETQGKDQDMDADEAEDLDEMDDNMWPSGAPMMIGKPFAIDITKMLRPQGGRRGGSPSSIMSALFDDEPSRPSNKKHDNHIFKEVVSSILSAPEAKRSKVGAAGLQSHAAGNGANIVAATANTEKEDSGSIPLQSVSRKRLLIYVEAIDALEDHNLGKQFLSELYMQVHQRRVDQELMIVGAPPYVSQERREMFSSTDTASATSIVVLTPPDVAPQDASRFRRLSAQNTTAMNYRNLRTFLKAKWNAEAWASFDPHSPTFLDDVAKISSMPETDILWNKQFIGRLAAVIWGKLEQNPAEPPSITQAKDLLDESDRSKSEWLRKRSKDRPLHHLNPADTPLSRIRSSATKHEKALLAGVIEPSKISVTFKDVHAPFETIEAIQTMTTLSLVRPEAFRYGVLASDRLPGLLLYGPPGTGKTLLAKAVAKESGATVLSVSSAQLNDMYVGEGEKNVAALFSLAKKLTPCVIFLDEADAIFSARGNRGSRVNHRELLNQFLTEWDGMSNDASGAFIMVATNRPMDLDDAVLRRLPRRLLVDLPTESDRLAILNIHLRDEVLAEGVDLAELAKKTPFYSGSDLKNLAVAAALECVREENEAAKKHVGAEPYMHAEKRTLTVAHFEKALSEISASISEDMTSLRDIKKFDEQYGDKRGKKRKSARWGFSTVAEANKVLDTVKVRS